MDRMKINNYFERVYCVNLRRRQDRLKIMQQNVEDVEWPFNPIQYVPAVDGQLVRPPEWWNSGWGAWGCFRTHVRLIEDCLNDGVESVLLLEDDATFPSDFVEQVTQFLQRVPNDWGMLYLGGQHLRVNTQEPTVVPHTDNMVYRPFNVNRTHAWALRGKMMLKTYKHLHRKDWHRGNHVDHHLGRLHQRREDPIYCPQEWLVGQNEGKSNISGKTAPIRFWRPAEDIAEHSPDNVPFVAVVGTHSSGTSCTAGLLHHLGVHMGNELVGFYGRNPDKNCGFEASGLVDLCEKAVPFPATKYNKGRRWIWRHLRDWIQTRRREASQQGTIAGGKYPMLCRMGDQLKTICGDQLRVVAVDRPLQKSIKSIQRRCPDKNQDQLDRHMHWLNRGKTDLVESLPKEQVLKLKFKLVVKEPDIAVRKIIKFLGLTPTEDQIQTAVNSVKPDLVHVPV